MEPEATAAHILSPSPTSGEVVPLMIVEEMMISAAKILATCRIEQQTPSGSLPEDKVNGVSSRFRCKNSIESGATTIGGFIQGPVGHGLLNLKF
jgi:hypothetical protein